MALAILAPAGDRGTAVRFRIDTGTNPYYQLKIGRKVRRRHGIDWVNEVYFTTPIAENDAAGRPLDSSTVVTVPRARIEQGRAFAQLFSFKTATGRSPAYSDVVPLLPPGGEELLAMSTTLSAPARFASPRRVPCRTGSQELAQQASLGDLLGQLVRLAGPAVLGLLGGGRTGGSGPAPSVSPDVAATIVDAVLRSLTGGTIGPLLSGQQSRPIDNRFSQPFVFGIDDALLASLVGPLVQVLPQLANAANQKRLDLRREDNKLVHDILSDIERRRLLEQVMAAQRTTGPAADADITALLQLLQQAAPPTTSTPPPATPSPAPVATPAPVAPAAPAPTTPAVTHSLSLQPADGSVLSARAVVSFVTGAPITLDGADAVVFAKRVPLRLRIRLDVGEPVPKAPLPKAIVTLTVKDRRDEVVLLTKTFKLKNVVANVELPLDIAPEETASLPTGQRLAVLAELRWQGAAGEAVHKALGAVDVTFVDRWLLRERGATVSDERELTDLQQFRAFWNKVWESPVLDGAAGAKKLLWELDVAARYSVVLTPEHDSNGLMETKVLAVDDPLDSVSARTQGRMKAGIELSITELNKLTSLWEGAPALPPDQLQALLDADLGLAGALEVVHTIKLKGKAAQRGMVWIGPVLRLVELTLATATSTDPTGQVTALGEEKVRFPLPVAVRILGVKSE